MSEERLLEWLRQEHRHSSFSRSSGGKVTVDESALRRVLQDSDRLDALESVHLRWHDFGGEWNVWINGEKRTGNSLRAVADKVLAVNLTTK